MNNSTTSAWSTSPAAARAIPFAVFIAFIALQSAVGERLQSMGLDTRWFYAVRAIAVACLLVFFWRQYSEMHDTAGITGRRVAAALAAGIAVFVLWINLDFAWARVGAPSAFDPTLPGGAGFAWELVFFRLLGLAVIVPVMEELFWRSFLMRWIDRHDFLAHEPAKVSIRAMLICAALFALEHNLWLAGLLAGLVYGIVYVRTGNIWLPIISHATTNAALGGWILATGQWQYW